jgi:hypothetical protein
MENNPIEKCLICGKDTPYRFNDDVDTRIGYIEGAGQGCYQSQICNEEPNKQLITISEELIYSTPNDQELGNKVRKIYWQTKKWILCRIKK